jgi:hypothetical protein
MKYKIIFFFLLSINIVSGNQRELVDRKTTLAISSDILNGLSDIKKGKLNLGISKWEKASIFGDEYILTISNILRELPNSYGKYQGSDFLKIHSLSKAYHKVFILMRYDKRPIIIQFDTYSSKKDEVYKIAFIKIYKDIHKLIPPELQENAN